MIMIIWELYLIINGFIDHNLKDEYENQKRMRIMIIVIDLKVSWFPYLL